MNLQDCRHNVRQKIALTKQCIVNFELFVGFVSVTHLISYSTYFYVLVTIFDSYYHCTTHWGSKQTLRMT